MDSSRLSLKEALNATLLRLIHLSMSGFWRYAKEHGISMTQMIAMRQMYHHGDSEGCSISTISEKLGVTHAAVSQSLDKLVQMGLVSRTENPQDRRSKQVSLTPRGEAFLAESARSRQVWMDSLVETFSPEEAERVADALRLLIEKWDDLAA